MQHYLSFTTPFRPLVKIETNHYVAQQSAKDPGLESKRLVFPVTMAHLVHGLSPGISMCMYLLSVVAPCRFGMKLLSRWKDYQIWTMWLDRSVVRMLAWNARDYDFKSWPRHNNFE